MKKIQLGGHYKNSQIKGYALIDDEDFPLISEYKWQRTSHGYAITTTYPPIYMHRMINKTSDNMITDHINRNGLDNRKINLRSVGKSLNATNTEMRKTNTSGYKGVHFSKRGKKWEAYIFKDYKKMALGYFKNLKDAIEARKQAELIYHI
jgi:hypothetical protein